MQTFDFPPLAGHWFPAGNSCVSHHVRKGAKTFACVCVCFFFFWFRHGEFRNDGWVRPLPLLLSLVNDPREEEKGGHTDRGLVIISIGGVLGFDGCVRSPWAHEH